MTFLLKFQRCYNRRSVLRSWGQNAKRPNHEALAIALTTTVQGGLPFVIPKDWSTKQAVAVIDLLDDVREVIYQHYGHKIMKYRRKERGTVFDGGELPDGDDALSMTSYRDGVAVRMGQVM